jgi:dihydroceramidase
MQLLDELSMIYTACTLFFAIFSLGRSRLWKVILCLSVTSLAAFITGYYHYLQDPAFHQNAFALICVAAVFTSIYDMEQKLRPSRRSSGTGGQKNGHVKPIDQAERARVDARDARILKEMWLLVAGGLISVGLGFLLWNLDNIFCSTLRSWRRQVGLPWGILLEGHGWW